MPVRPRPPPHATSTRWSAARSQTSIRASRAAAGSNGDESQATAASDMATVSDPAGDRRGRARKSGEGPSGIGLRSALPRTRRPLGRTRIPWFSEPQPCVMSPPYCWAGRRCFGGSATGDDDVDSSGGVCRSPESVEREARGSADTVRTGAGGDRAGTAPTAYAKTAVLRGDSGWVHGDGGVVPELNGTGLMRGRRGSDGRAGIPTSSFQIGVARRDKARICPPSTSPCVTGIWY